MPNINTLFSNQPKDDKTAEDDSDEEENARYVGGVSSRGGGSGLAVLPDRDTNRSAIFQRAEDRGGNDAEEDDVSRRIITMYRDGFTVDDGPYRRLDDPRNAEFLSSLARGITPRELLSDSKNGEIAIGLVDKRTEDYVETFRSFSGSGQSLGVSGPSASGVIDPNVAAVVKSASTTNKDSKLTSIQVRLLSGKRLVVKLSLNVSVQALIQEILASGEAGSEPFVLMGGFPPRQITDLNATIEDAGLAGSSVTQKKA